MEKSRLSLMFCAIAIGAAGTGCSQGTVGIGDQQPSTQLKTGLAAFAANWDGYIEAHTFQDSSDRVRISVNSDATGSVRFGEEELLPPASDPNAKYPPSYPNAGGVVDSTPLPSSWSGFEFTLNSVRVDTERLRASAASKEVFSSWCSIQVPKNLDTDVYSCVACDLNRGTLGDSYDTDAGANSDSCYTYDPCPSANLNPAYDAWAMNPIGPPPPSPTVLTVLQMCEQQALCGTGKYEQGVRISSNGDATCTCDANSCTIVSNLAQDIQLDAALENSQQTMTGTLALGGSHYIVRLKRQ